MKRISRAVLLATLGLSGVIQAEEKSYTATLVGHAWIPALSLLTPPADAPQDAWLSGKFIDATRNQVPMSRYGNTGALHGNRSTELATPFIGQPLQGLSGFAMEQDADGAFYVLTDNGFGSKANSPDAMLFFHRMAPNFDTGQVDVKETIYLRDPGAKIPFRIAYEGTESRYLTGADFDPESIQLVNDEIWIGEEFGPYLIRAGLDGTIRAVYPTQLNGATLKSPDNPSISALANVGSDWQVPRSGGFEGLALQPETGLLWAMLEKPLLDANGEPDGRDLNVMAFDPVAGEWTGEHFRFPLADGATAIGDFNFIDRDRALVIERDNGEGDPSLACQGDARPDCFPHPAKHKRVVLIDTSTLDENGRVARLGYVDLMAIADPDDKSRLDTQANRDLSAQFTFPFFTIENVVKVDDRHIMVANDNNLPGSTGRQLDAAADNEFILLDVADFLNAR
ncbi:esterase-like activity of phytase family protein [Halomonas halocynthiae]|uniref:esterase-like activity of phytase family protein n=1 Tax=Halomonas halocynthiae TaxID=176290 RepID=UPI000421C89E|nr:esterase-like activity of phytase family protein [Halomonas halocynthiae]